MARPFKSHLVLDGSTESVHVDGVEQPDKTIPFVADHQEHSVEVRIHVVAG